VLPRLDRALSTREQWLLRNVPGLQLAVRSAIYGFTETIQLAQRRPAAMRYLQRIGESHLRRQVKDPALLRALTPKFTLGCKRMLFSNTWYLALQAPNAEVVPHAATQVTADGIVGADGVERKVDTIIFGTGFYVTNTAMSKTVVGRYGRTLGDLWAGSPQAYIGTTCHGFPNAFLMFGPNTANGHGSALVVIEAQARYVVDAIATAKRDAIVKVEVRADAQNVWNDRVQSALAGTVFNTGCASFYVDDNGRNSAIYPWTTIDLRRRLRRFDRSQFELSPTS
jgi:cation diffusion facilitator CzcD-associated flavoprotein CzcO